MNWLGWKWYFLSFSLIFSVSGLISMGWHWTHIGSPIPLGVDFRGGTEVTVQFRNPPDIGAIRSAIDSAGYPDAKIQPIQGEGEVNQALISLPERQNEANLDIDRQKVIAALEQHYSANPFDPNKDIQLSVVGPTVGKQLQDKAIQATLLSLAGMLVYLWFRFQLIYGVAAVVACFHDTLITVGAFALTGQEISLTVVRVSWKHATTAATP